MRRLSLVALTVLLTAFVAACDDDDSPTGPSDQNPAFLSQLTPGNEVPPVTNADSSGKRSSVTAFNVTRDSGRGRDIGDLAGLQVSLAGFPAGTTLTGAHIHPGAAGATGGVACARHRPCFR